MYYNMSTCS